MPRRLGVDGARGGWLIAHVDARQPPPWTPEFLLVASLTDILDRLDPTDRVAVDCPIGLLDAPQPGGRTCDRLARARLAGRASSIFSPPTRLALAAADFRTAQARQGGGLTRQGFHLSPRIRELDAWLTPARQAWITEAHPELAFQRLNQDQPLPGKRDAAGRAARLAQLKPWIRWPTEPQALARRIGPRRLLAPDDVLDACVLLITAWRWQQGDARCLPADPPRDAQGLRMAIRF